MASMATPAPCGSQSREWITPEEQIIRLFTPFVEQQLYRNGYLEKLERTLYQNVELVTRSILTRSILPDLNSGTEKRVSSLFDLSLERLCQPDLLPSILTDWYTALKLRGALPNLVPSLPPEMTQILDSKCPIWGDERKPDDGNYYKYLDKWSLSLQTDETLNELEASASAYGERVLNNRGQKLYPGENPLRFRFFRDLARNEHGDIRPSDTPYWILHTNTVLPGSRYLSPEEQDRMVADLSGKTSVNFEVPLLRETVTTYFNRKIARGESLYQDGTQENNYLSTSTRVKETTRNTRLIVGKSLPSGLGIQHFDWDLSRDHIGVAAVRRF